MTSCCCCKKRKDQGGRYQPVSVREDEEDDSDSNMCGSTLGWSRAPLDHAETNPFDALSRLRNIDFDSGTTDNVSAGSHCASSVSGARAAVDKHEHVDNASAARAPLTLDATLPCAGDAESLGAPRLGGAAVEIAPSGRRWQIGPIQMELGRWQATTQPKSMGSAGCAPVGRGSAHPAALGERLGGGKPHPAAMARKLQTHSKSQTTGINGRIKVATQSLKRFSIKEKLRSSKEKAIQSKDRAMQSMQSA